MSRSRPSLLLYAFVVLAAVLADQATKFLAVAHLTHAFESAGAEGLGEELGVFFTGDHPAPKAWVKVVDSFWNHRYVENPGAAWSFAGDWPASVRKPFFLAIPLFGLVLIAWYFRQSQPSQKLLRTALALVFAGALGNWLDRLFHGYVIDFIDWHWNDPDWLRPPLHFPTFNVADAAITVGIALILVDGVAAYFESRRALQPAPKP